MNVIVHPEHDERRKYYAVLMEGFDYWNLYQVKEARDGTMIMQAYPLHDDAPPLTTREAAETALACLGEPVPKTSRR